MSEHDPYSRVNYRRLIAWPERIRREWPLLEKVLGDGPSRRVLEVGCGPAQHARALVDGGFEVVGVDRSEAMLSAAREEPLPEGLTLVQGDMLEVDRLVEGTFGAALCLGNVLPQVESEEGLRRFAGALARVLEPGAPFLLQILNYDRIHGQRVRSLPINFRPGPGGEEGAEAGDESEIVFLRLMTPLPDGRVLFYPTTLVLEPGAEEPVRVDHGKEVVLRGWRRAEVERVFAEAGLEPERAFGGVDESPFEPLESQDLVLVSRRV